MIDIVLPNKNEEEFIKMAQRLGISALIFAYKNKSEFYMEKTAFPITNALLAEPASIRRAHDSNISAICSGTREAIERGADLAYNFELQETKDPTHHRASGLNQVLCKLATDKKVRIGFSVSTIIVNTGQKRAILLGRMMQNIAFCTKYKTPMKIASFATEPYQMRAPAELTSLFHQLGMQTNDIQQALK